MAKSFKDQKKYSTKQEGIKSIPTQKRKFSNESEDIDLKAIRTFADVRDRV
jgi:hypothetical protein